jgi:hypothetical protein
MGNAYRTSPIEASPQTAPLPSLAEIARARAMTLSAPSAALRGLFEQIAAAVVAEVLRDTSFWKSVLFAGGVTSAIATVTGAARLLMTPGSSPVPLLVISFVVGTIYGVVRVALSNTKWVDKDSGQEVTPAIPLVYGFGLGMVAFGIEALLSLIPVPSIVLAPLLATACFTVWFKRYRPGLRFNRIPEVGISRSLLMMADPTALSSIAWNDPAALPPDGLTYRASIKRPDAILVTCASYRRPPGLALQVIVEFPASYRWRHPSERVVMEGITLEVSATPASVVVQATNTHAAATPRLFVHALSIAVHACAPPGV